MEHDDTAAQADAAIAATLPRRTRETLEAEIAQACLAHDLYLADYGGLGEALRLEAEAAR